MCKKTGGDDDELQRTRLPHFGTMDGGSPCGAHGRATAPFQTANSLIATAVATRGLENHPHESFVELSTPLFTIKNQSPNANAGDCIVL